MAELACMQKNNCNGLEYQSDKFINVTDKIVGKNAKYFKCSTANLAPT
jgi:hypothetical protein